jgi:hypothetical protein
MSRMPVTAFEETIPRLLEIGWLEVSEISELETSGESSRKTAVSAPENVGYSQETASPSLENVYGREGREEYGTERNGTEAPAHNEPQSLNGPFDRFVAIWRGGINEDCWRVFGEKVNTPERLAAFTANVPLWAQIRRYSDGFTDGNTFLRSGVWLLPPKPELLPKGDVFDRAIANSREDAGE